MSGQIPVDATRRSLLGIAAVAAAGFSAHARAAGSGPMTTGDAEHGPGVPVPTAVVTTSSGPVRGLILDGVQSFRGVRYGAAPVGELRWMPPQRPQPWKAVYDASDFGAPAMQLASGSIIEAPDEFGFQMHRVFTTPSEFKVMNEDCLYLNVWTPAIDSRKRPVMFWIHGGGFAFGSGSQTIYQGDGLAKAGDVVVVSVNHRLNVFGYLHLGDAMGSQYGTSGTAGMQDLVLALQWVHDNIAGFGGDPGNVMIMGQSGGGAKVSILLSMPSAKGLFHKAAIQSGPGLAVGRKPQAAEATRRLLTALNVKEGDIAALRAIPAQQILEATAKIPGLAGGPVRSRAIPSRRTRRKYLRTFRYWSAGARTSGPSSRPASPGSAT
jgi:para-nitrobenzyl esterase